MNRTFLEPTGCGQALPGAARSQLKVSEPEPAYFRRGGLGGVFYQGLST